MLDRAVFNFQTSPAGNKIRVSLDNSTVVNRTWLAVVDDNTLTVARRQHFAEWVAVTSLKYPSTLLCLIFNPVIARLHSL
jgi:hypothetical protein